MKIKLFFFSLNSFNFISKAFALSLKGIKSTILGVLAFKSRSAKIYLDPASMISF
jgi:hypothetical protein